MTYSNILIPIDGSDCSMNAVKKGIELAKDLSANVILLCIVDLSPIINNAAVGAVIDNEVEVIYKEDAADTLGEAFRAYPYDKAIRLIEEGTPQEVINAIANERKVDLIIMGTHGRTGLNHLFMGSVAEYVIRHSKIPVMVVTSEA
jgi:nucleotide-binding universal stress UspA family protein